MRLSLAPLLLTVCCVAVAADSLVAAPSTELIVKGSLFDELKNLVGETFTDMIDDSMRDTETDMTNIFDRLLDRAKDTWKGLINGLKKKVKQYIDEALVKFDQWTQQYGVLGQAMRAAKDIAVKYAKELDFQKVKFDLTKTASEMAMKLAGEGAVVAAGLLQEKLEKLQDSLGDSALGDVGRGLLQVGIDSINSTMSHLRNSASSGEASIGQSLQSIVGILATSLGKVQRDLETTGAGLAQEALKKTQAELAGELENIYKVAMRKSDTIGGAVVSSQITLVAKEAELKAQLKSTTKKLEAAIASGDSTLQEKFEKVKAVLEDELATLVDRLKVMKDKVLEKLKGTQSKVQKIIDSIVQEIAKLTKKTEGRRLAGTPLDDLITKLKEMLGGHQDLLESIKAGVAGQLSILSNNFDLNGEKVEGIMAHLGELYAELAECEDCANTAKELILGRIGIEEGKMEEIEKKMKEFRVMAEEKLMKLASGILSGVGSSHQQFKQLTLGDSGAVKAELASQLSMWQERATAVWDAMFEHTSGIEASVGPATDFISEMIGKLAAQLTGSSGDLKSMLSTRLKGMRTRYDQFRAALSSEMSTGQESLAEVLFNVAVDVGGKLQDGASLKDVVKSGVQKLRGVLASAWRGQTADSMGVLTEVASGKSMLAKSIGVVRAQMREVKNDPAKVAELEAKAQTMEDRLMQLRGGLRTAWSKTWEKVDLAKARARTSVSTLEQAILRSSGTVRVQLEAALAKMRKVQDKMADVSEVTATFDDKLLGLAVKMASWKNSAKGIADKLPEGQPKEIMNFVVARMGWLSSNLRTAGNTAADLQEKFEVGQTRMAEMLGAIEGTLEEHFSEEDVKNLITPAKDTVLGFLDQIDTLQADLEPKIKTTLSGYLDEFQKTSSDFTGIIDAVAAEAIQFEGRAMNFRRRLAGDDAIQAAMDCLDQTHYAVRELGDTTIATGALQDLRSAAVAERVARSADGTVSSAALAEVDKRLTSAYKESVYQDRYQEATIPAPDYEGKTSDQTGDVGDGGAKAVMWVLVILAILAVGGGLGFYYVKNKDAAVSSTGSSVEMTSRG